MRTWRRVFPGDFQDDARGALITARVRDAAATVEPRAPRTLRGQARHLWEQCVALQASHAAAVEAERAAQELDQVRGVVEQMIARMVFEPCRPASLPGWGWREEDPPSHPTAPPHTLTQRTRARVTTHRVLW